MSELTDAELAELRKIMSEHSPVNPTDAATFKWLKRFDATLDARDAEIATLKRAVAAGVTLLVEARAERDHYKAALEPLVNSVMRYSSTTITPGGGENGAKAWDDVWSALLIARAALTESEPS